MSNVCLDISSHTHKHGESINQFLKSCGFISGLILLVSDISFPTNNVVLFPRVSHIHKV